MSPCDLAVIGAGPGGYVASIRAAQLGLAVVCIEREAALGGTCLRVGCIPSKALLESSEHFHRAHGELARHGVMVQGVGLDLAAMMKRKTQVVSALTQGVAGLFKKNKVERLQGTARIAGKDGERWQVAVQTAGGEVVVSAKWVLVATGSVPVTLPGVALDGDRIGTSTEALSYPSVPEHLVVIGAGVIGLELGSVWRRLGAKVTVLEYADRILPGLDRDVSEAARKVFAKQGLEFRLVVRVTGAVADGGACRVTFAEGDQEHALSCDRVLVAVGRRPNTSDLGLAEAGVELDARGRIVTGDHFATTAAGIFAIG
ncbi:MAG: FAD-dependent oxidoreductase, partial [Deltaproteobacteria bacterium]|nr:FAD-dependent oxidoreductase [Deltaproteobacteria bacterium]